jgi:hypothetical protein
VRRSIQAFLRRNLREDELTKAAIAIALATLTVLAALVAGLQGHASIEAQRGKREADRIGLEALGRDSSATIQVNTAYGVYRRWFEQIERSYWAEDQQTVALNTSTAPQLDALYQAEVTLENWTKGQSSLFGATYLKSDGNPDTVAFETDVLQRNKALAEEQRQVETEVATTWDNKASDYITILTIVAVGLFFLGLGSTVARRARPFLSTAGIVFGVAGAAWAVLVYTAPIHRVPQAAIDREVEAKVAWFKTPDDRGAPKVSDDARKGYQAAIDATSAAIAIDSGYANAYKLRGDVRTDYADHLYFASGPSDETTTFLQGAIADYRQYLADNPNDYGSWWNLGWALYLVGRQADSVDATNQALIHSPAQFPLYLNRALAFLAGGDPTQAQADVDEAVRRAAQDSTDSAQFYLAESDFDIGRLSELDPAQTDVLRAVQIRLREAQVSLRVRGSVSPAPDAPQLAQVTVAPVRVKQYQGGVLAEGKPIPDGVSILTSDGVGVRATIPNAAALLGHTVSARVWLNGQPESDFNVDFTVKELPVLPVTLDVVSAYGRAGFALDPGAYQLDLFVDGARRYHTTWSVNPAPATPGLQVNATPLTAAFQRVGFTCGEPTASGAQTTTSCSVIDTDKTTYYADITADANDRLTYLVLAATTPDDSTVDVNAVAHTFFANIVKLLYTPDVANTATVWINSENTATDDLQLAGTTLRVFGNDAHSRNLDVRATWP